MAKMDRHKFELAALSRKAPSIEQLLVMFHAANDMTHEKAIGIAKDLCLHCCRLQQEIIGAEASMALEEVNRGEEATSSTDAQC